MPPYRARYLSTPGDELRLMLRFQNGSDGPHMDLHGPGGALLGLDYRYVISEILK